MILHPYFKLIGIEPGKVITARFGAIDFRQQVAFETLKSLYDDGFPYLKLTSEGKNALLNKNAAGSPTEMPPEGTIVPFTKKAVTKSNKKNNAGKSK